METARAAAAPRARPRLDRTSWAVVVLETLLALSALGGSWSLVAGSADLGASADRLPFDSLVLGGVALALIVAVPAAVAAVAAVRLRPWAPTAHVVVGGLLMGWIVVQVAFIGLTSWLQPVLFAWGAVIAGLGAALRRRRS